MPENCLQVDSFNRCIKCVESYSVSYGQCVKIQKPSIPPNCLQVDNKNKCVKCDEGYLVSNGLCTKIDEPTLPAICLKAVGNQCVQCIYEWILNPYGYCVPY
jgi:hypothetical protein